ncbi:Werner syndrome ATP-dependent helicase-like protein [Psilocybe cubensis]|uniref:Werner syndrome ATP-dependent helicase-like protein n=1 Tax=Psilocybe cubensis TaxID=181762 RepID=A0ACB8GL55_PSICU|nr:Werner syndrome ATP-dependent helicase-like protein [Psilocybe cubensis]KAH9475789.1 Werner syndrome ATP-dependent helicase-like protein [Psilocybe cubensis]
MDLESSYPQQSTRLGGPLLSHVSERTFDVPMPSQPREKEVHTLFNVTTPAHFHESGSATPYPVDLISRPRKRGRPLGSKSKSRAVGEDTDSSAHRRPVGRPKGSGTKAQQTPVVKKAVGRPRKSKPQISIEFGRVTIPGTFQPSRPPSGLPFPLHRGNSMPNLSGGSPLVSVDPSTRQTLPNPLFAQNPVLPNVSEPTSLSTIEIIPDEDPQRPVELADEDQDEDEETGMSGEGIGVDVGFEENQDEKGDELDPVDENVEDSEYQENTGRRIRHARPVWLLEAFEAKVLESAPEKRDKHGLPPLYSKNCSFWFPRPAIYFILQRNKPSPHELWDIRFYLWDPQALFKRIPCPICKSTLQRHANISYPRRCIDIDSEFYLIGYRYRCSVCTHPKSGKHTVTFNSWDSRILSALPQDLAAEFPAILSHRSAISKRLFQYVRSSFQNGLGAKQISDTIRVHHLLKYDELHLQYLNQLAGRKLDKWREEKYMSFPRFDDISPHGRHGFTPSAQWIRNMYDRFIMEHIHDFNQHMSMLSAEICALDHSHKITKHIAKVNGEEIFTGLLTVTNERGEIRSCSLVATKSHSQYQLALKQMLHSLKMYGHSEPKLAFTDNVASDKAFLEDAWPSLRESVVPVEKYPDLEPLAVPTPPIAIFVKSTASAIDAAMASILDDLDPSHPDKKIVIGFDSEWNVEVSSNGHILHRGQTAIIQIAYKSSIYILQIGDMLAGGTLPSQLRILLENPNIVKAGRLVEADLKHLQTASQSPKPFVGALDLAKYAKDKMVISSARCSLADLCALVLGKRLNKNVPERISSAWENEILTRDQLAYAACDAYACICIYNKLSTLETPQVLPSQFNAGIPVLLFNTDKASVIARGKISSHKDDRQLDGINITTTRTAVDIEEVFVPGALISSHRNCSLASFGTPPFTLVCLRSHLKTFSPTFWTHHSSQSDSSSRAQTSPMSLDQSSNQDLLTASLAELDDNDLSLDATFDDDSIPSIGNLVVENHRPTSAPPITTDHPRNIDPESASLGQQVLDQYPNTWDSTIRSRVLKDVFHVFNMFHISSTHGLRAEFARQLRDAIFIPDGEDRAKISAWGAMQTPPLTFEQIQKLRPRWLWKRCKRIIPPADILHGLLKKVFETFGPLKDATTGAPLFNFNDWKTSGHILDLTRRGFISDPPGIPLYAAIGIDSAAPSLTIYRCFRGTNMTEGGVHTHLRSHLPSSGASVQHVYSCLADFTLHHNLVVGTFNSTGQKYRSHFSIWLTNSIQERLSFLHDVLINPVEITGWVNGNLYIPTTETLGILPIPTSIRIATGMSEFIPSIDKKQRHAFLAQMQHTRKPILPIHNDIEKQLFRDLMQANPDYNSLTSGPIWKKAVKVWNHYADINSEISYKLIEQLKSYYAHWKTNLNVKESLFTTYDIRKPLAAILSNPSRSVTAPRVPEKTLKPLSVDDGLLPTSVSVGTFNTNRSEVHGNNKDTPVHDDQQTPLQSANSDLLLPHSTTRKTFTTATNLAVHNRVNREALSEKRVREQIQRSHALDKGKRPRTCAKCGSTQCSGRQRVKHCHNRCRDCGNVKCKGRYTKRPDKPCYVGWVDVPEERWPKLT